MINLGLIDVLLIVALIVSFVYALRARNLLVFAVVLVIVLLIELERMVPGTITALNKAIHSIDLVNAQLPHIQIHPNISITP
jgi:hypothetical protein